MHTGIAKTFSTDLILDPASTRDVQDVKHEVAAVGSRSVEKAQTFIDDNKLGKQAKAYGSYAEVYADPVSPMQQVEGEDGNWDARVGGRPMTFG